jgi:hypothetical protein
MTDVTKMDVFQQFTVQTRIRHSIETRWVILNMNYTVWQPDKNGVSNMLSIYARVTQNESTSSVFPDMHYENETIQIMYVDIADYLHGSYWKSAVFITEKQLSVLYNGTML